MKDDKFIISHQYQEGIFQINTKNASHFWPAFFCTHSLLTSVLTKFIRRVLRFYFKYNLRSLQLSERA